MEAYGVAIGNPVVFRNEEHQTLSFETLSVNHEFPEGFYDAILVSVVPGVSPFFAKEDQVIKQTVRIFWPGLPVNPSGKPYDPLFFELEN